MSYESMPKKSNEGEKFRLAGLDTISKTVQEGDKVKDIFRRVYRREPTSSEEKTFRNRLDPKRANPGLDFLGLYVSAHDELKNMTLGEFFGLDD